ncbi:MAG: cob(I)yrinic acid a,c-diamide adenosyltransferase, partial [Acidihalobacter sp.]
LSLPGQQLIDAEAVTRLEWSLDGFNEELPPLREFILPGGGQAASACHLARAVCRRAERSVIALARAESVGEALRQYLNRLSDLLFVLARVLAREAGEGEVFWRKADTE